LLDLKTLIAKTNDEFVEPIVAIDLHDVPQDRLSANLYHGLGAGFRFLGDSRTQSACENDNFHERLIMK
jgi:hypothetical protein